MTTVILLNPFGTDVTNFVNGTALVPQLLRGTVMQPGDTLYTVPYVNQSGIANINAGVTLLNTKLLNTSGPKLVFSYSEGCQVADSWIAQNANSVPVPADKLSFLSIGNADRKYGGFCFGHSCFNEVGYSGGLPASVPWPYTDFARQYDGVADFPTSTAIQAALVDLQVSLTDSKYLTAAMNAISGLVAITAESDAAQNAVAGMLWVHNFYFDVAPSDPANLWYTDSSGVRYGLSPTYPVPLLGPSTLFPSVDQSLRRLIEQCYSRPFTTVPTPNYNAYAGWPHGWVFVKPKKPRRRF